mgnify:CR=1 FL=1
MTDLEELAEFIFTELTYSNYSNFDNFSVTCKQCGRTGKSKSDGYKIKHITDCIVEIAERNLPYE